MSEITIDTDTIVDNIIKIVRTQIDCKESIKTELDLLICKTKVNYLSEISKILNLTPCQQPK